MAQVVVHDGGPSDQADRGWGEQGQCRPRSPQTQVLGECCDTGKPTQPLQAAGDVVPHLEIVNRTSKNQCMLEVLCKSYEKACSIWS